MSEQTSVVVSPVATLEAQVADLTTKLAAAVDLIAALAAKKTRKEGTGHSTRHGTWNGLTPTALLRALGYAGWTQTQMAKVLTELGFVDVTPATVSTQHGWGKQWAKENPKCGEKHKPYGSRPVVLTEEQLAELVRVRDGIVEKVAVTDGMREAFGLVA